MAQVRGRSHVLIKAKSNFSTRNLVLGSVCMAQMRGRSHVLIKAKSKNNIVHALFQIYPSGLKRELAVLFSMPMLPFASLPVNLPRY